MMPTIDRAHLSRALAAEIERFRQTHPRSQELFKQAQRNLLGGVPMNWMSRWASPFPVFVKQASGARFEDVDGNEYLDLCLGDTGAMTGHAPPASIEPIIEQMRRGITLMLPTEDAIHVGAELERRFGLPYWQFALTATDANRFSLRLARAISGRPKVLVFNYCYHGTVDETLIALRAGQPVPRPGTVGPSISPTLTTKVVEFNDIPALEAALAPGDVAAVLAEPALTNIGIVHPQPGYHEALREISRRTGTLLILDETHTICAGPGGYTAAHGLQPDMLTVGKPLGSGIPGAVYGLSAEIADRARVISDSEAADVGGIGGTLAGNALSIAAMRATLDYVLTEQAYQHTIPLAERFTQGVQTVIEEFGLGWHINRLGCRAEYWFCAEPPRNGGEANAAVDEEMDQYMHLAALNRGILMTPFHNMALFCPAHTEADVDRHTEVFKESVAALLGGG
jgi:glutamate-1-semialdehyde 2,1-aminomutase